MIYLSNECYASELNVHPKNWKTSRASLKKDWFISYRFYDPLYKEQPALGKGKLVIVKGMNHYKTIAERRAATEVLIQKELEKLQVKVFNPITGFNLENKMVF